MIKDLADFVIDRIRKISEVGDERSKDCIKGLVNYLVRSIGTRACCSLSRVFHAGDVPFLTCPTAAYNLAATAKFNLARDRCMNRAVTPLCKLRLKHSEHTCSWIGVKATMVAST